MAFETIRGESGIDFIGTDGVDALFALNETGIKKVDAKGGNDTVDLFDESGVVGTAEVKLGEGDDTFTMGANSTITNRLSESTVNGGPGDDNITTEGTLSSKLRGNEGDDDFFLVSNYTATTINGNSGQDSFTVADVAAVNNVVLSDTKILGGSGNDGQMDFTPAAGDSIRAVDSVIQGGKGLDTITIGALAAGTSGFRVSGGADNDTLNITQTTGTVDGVAYNGAGGDDAINFLNGNAGDAVTKGGEGNDRITLNLGTGAIDALGEAGDDFFQLNINEVAVTSTGGKNTITGGAGSDTYNFEAVAAGDRTETTFVIASVADSPAAITGSALTFDTFNGSGAVINNTVFGDVIDMRGGAGEELVGNRLADDEIANAPGAVLAAGDELTSTTFAAVKAALDGQLTQSDSNIGGNLGRISTDIIKIDTGNNNVEETIDGYYLILNNTNRILDSGDMMIGLATSIEADDAAGDDDALAIAEATQIIAAIEAGYSL